MGAHRHPDEEVERTYFRPPPPPPLVRVGSTRLATVELPLLTDEPEQQPAEPAKAERQMPGWVNATGEAVWYFLLALTAGYGAFRLVVDLGAQFITS